MVFVIYFELWISYAHDETMQFLCNWFTILPRGDSVDDPNGTV
jgi:hypothetical protein